MLDGNIGYEHPDNQLISASRPMKAITFTSIAEYSHDNDED